MRVFITGGTGFVGSAIVRELIVAGHTVTGLARTTEAADKLVAAGADALRGELSDLPELRAAAANADAVIHCAFVHDFANYAESARTDLRAVEAMVDALAEAGPGKVFVNTAGTAMLTPGQVGAESDGADPASPGGHRVQSEQAALAAATRGLRSAVVRLPPSVHGAGDHGFIPILVELARRTGVSAFVGAGENHWPAVHREDAAVLYRLAIERLADGSIPPGTALHCVADKGIPFREIATVIADRLELGLAVSRSSDHFGWFAKFAGVDNPVTSDLTNRLTRWQPTRPGLLADLRGMGYDDVFRVGSPNQ